MKEFIPRESKEETEIPATDGEEPSFGSKIVPEEKEDATSPIPEERAGTEHPFVSQPPYRSEIKNEALQEDNPFTFENNSDGKATDTNARRSNLPTPGMA